MSFHFKILRAIFDAFNEAMASTLFMTEGDEEHLLAEISSNRSFEQSFQLTRKKLLEAVAEGTKRKLIEKFFEGKFVPNMSNSDKVFRCEVGSRKLGASHLKNYIVMLIREIAPN
ncbi:hypothetical protein TNCV_3730031 [Trichonephila clavipes]|nr:hypothetical protein TNCV_3730031 [Trichonephila clavipes]